MEAAFYSPLECGQVYPWKRNSAHMKSAEHVTTEGTTLVKHAEERRGWLTEQVFVRKVIELHDKYLAYVNGRDFYFSLGSC
ncbi:hypothetical protein Tco_1478111 [Tanacetum coccineum]